MQLRSKRAVAVVAAMVAGGSALIAGGTAQAATAVNYAHSHASGWDHDSFDVAFKIRHTHSEHIEAANIADADSRDCHGCRSVAIAFEIVVDGRAPVVVDAYNHGSAVNVDCDHCQTLGIAYQFIVAKPTELSGDDQAHLWGIERELWSLEWSDAPADQLAAKVKDLADQTADILANAGQGYRPVVHDDVTWHD